MWDFIVMGQIPGTSIQVTFAAWLFAVATLILLAMMYSFVRHALASDEPLAGTDYPGSPNHSQSLTLFAQLLLAFRVYRIMHQAGYSRQLILRQQIKA